MSVDGNTDFPVGTGGFEDMTNGVPQSSNFFGQSGWWTVPTSWYSKCVDGVIYVSPNADFSNPCYVAKLNHDYTLVFFDMMRNLVSGNLRT